MTLNEGFADTGWSPRGAISQWRAARARFANDNDAYDSGSHIDAWFAGAAKVVGPVGAVAFIGGVAGSSAPLIAAASAIAGAVGYLGVGKDVGKGLDARFRNKFKR